MTPLCTLVAGLLLAAQPPIPFSPAARTPTPQEAIPKPTGFRAAGVDATVTAMRREQQQVARRVAEAAMSKRNGGVSTDADLHATFADIQRYAEIEKGLAVLDGERVEAILTQILSLSELEDYFRLRAGGGLAKEEAYLFVRFHRLGARASLLEEVKADPAVVRRHRESQVAVGKRRDELFAKRVEGGGASAEEMLLRAESVSSEAASAAARAATPAERDAVNRKAVESLKDAEKYLAQGIAGGIARESTMYFVTYLRLDAELREVNAAEKPPVDRVLQLVERRRGVIRKTLELMVAQRNGGMFHEADTEQFRKAQGYLVEAELALAVDAEARRVLLKRNLEVAVEHEEYFAKRVAAGIVGQSQRDRSICDRIEAESRLNLAK